MGTINKTIQHTTLICLIAFGKKHIFLQFSYCVIESVGRLSRVMHLLLDNFNGVWFYLHRIFPRISLDIADYDGIVCNWARQSIRYRICELGATRISLLSRNSFFRKWILRWIDNIKPYVIEIRLSFFFVQLIMNIDLKQFVDDWFKSNSVFIGFLSTCFWG